MLLVNAHTMFCIETSHYSVCHIFQAEFNEATGVVDRETLLLYGGLQCPIDFIKDELAAVVL